MTGSQTGAAVSIKVLVEQHEVAPVWIGLELFEFTENRTPTVFIAKKYPRQPAGELGRYFPQRQHFPTSGRELNLKIVPQIVMKLLERFNQQIVQWEPHRSSPVGVSAEQPGGRFARFVVDAVLCAICADYVRMLAMKLRQGTNAVRGEK